MGLSCMTIESLHKGQFYQLQNSNSVNLFGTLDIETGLPSRWKPCFSDGPQRNLITGY